jgi:Rha family phage regulatory protein
MSKNKSTRKSRKSQSDDARALAQTFIIRGQKAFATSLDVAERFGREHYNVLQSIRNLECSDSFRRLSFQAADYIDDQGKPRQSYEMNRDGFTMLAFGFKGSEAAAWREKYIAAFNWMEAELTRRAFQQQDEVWQQQRLSGKVARLDLTDGIKVFVGYAKEQGSQSAEKYYLAITRMEYRALFLIEQAVGKGFRDVLTTIQNNHLTTAESVAQTALEDGMTQALHYKDIYQLAKNRVEQFAALVGKSVPGTTRERTKLVAAK